MLYEFASFALDTSKRQLTREGEVLSLAPKAFDLLLLLVGSGGRALSKAELMHALWPDTIVEEANLSFQISTLRKALGENGAKWIETLPKHGYRFTGDVRRLEDRGNVPFDESAPRKRLNRWTGWSRVAAIGAAAILALILSTWMAGRASRLANDSASASPAVPLTAWPGHQQSPNLSPDGSQVVFSWNSGDSDNYDIYVKLVGPGEPIRLTTDPAIDDQPAWSPDGQSIAFLRLRSQIHADIFMIPALGGAERKVASVRLPGPGRSFGAVKNLAWTPDGKWLAFAGSPTNIEAPGIWIVAATGGEQRRLTAVPASDCCDWAPAFTSDGRYLAFIREHTLARSMVYAMPLSRLAPAGAPQRVSPEPANHLSIAWKPDGSGLLMASAGHLSLSRTFHIPFRPGRTADPQDVRLLPFGERARAISIARNGRVVYSAQYRDANLWRADLASPEQTKHVQVAASTLDEHTPDYSPDGNHLAFASTRSGVEEIWLARADGSNPKQMTFTGGPQCANPRWSPDGRLILFNSRREGSADLYLLDPKTGESRRITNHPGEELEARWSCDGQTIYFGSNRTGRYEVWRMPATGGEPVQITRDGGHTASESPDGRYLFYSKYETFPGAIWRVPVSGGREEPVVDGLSYALNFVVGKRGIYFLAAVGARNQTSLDYFDYATGKRSTLARVGKPFWWGMALSPDEKSLLYSVVDSAGSNLMLVDGFR